MKGQEMAESKAKSGNPHPYVRLENTPFWKVIEVGIADLVENRDIVEKTDRRYIVGYICEAVSRRAETLRILERAGKGNAPMKGDELPPKLRKKSSKI
jgi:hypothetical protein